MKKFTYKYEKINTKETDTLYASHALCIDDILFFDIETTGLSKEKNSIYLIGCGYYLSDSLNIIQWFAEKPDEEHVLLNEFKDFISTYKAFINFNGYSFDVPFVKKRMEKYGIPFNPDEFINIDLYTYVKPYKKLLGLNDLKQKTVERFLNIKRTDLFSGGELIDVYNMYVKKYIRLGVSDEDMLNKLILHNLEDVKNMHCLLPLINFTQLEKLDSGLMSYVNHEARSYTGYNSCNAYEIIICCDSGFDLKLCFTSIITLDSKTYALKCDGNGIKLRVPVFCGSLNYYFENYKDYYFLPNENMCVLKSVASGVAKENRQNATKENCKITSDDKFIFMPQNDDNLKKFKAGYNSKFEYIRLDDFDAMSVSQKSGYASAIIRLFMA